MFSCDICKRVFSRKYNLKRHNEGINCNLNGINFICKCGKDYALEKYYKLHIKKCSIMKIKINNVITIPQITEDKVEKVEEPNKYSIILMEKHGITNIDISTGKIINLIKELYTEDVFIKDKFVEVVLIEMFKSKDGNIQAILSDIDRCTIKVISNNTIVFLNPKSIIDLYLNNNDIMEMQNKYLNIGSGSNIFNKKYIKKELLKLKSKFIIIDKTILEDKPKIKELKGYNEYRISSYASLSLFERLNAFLNINIKHYKNGGELKIKTDESYIKIDGYYRCKDYTEKESLKTIFPTMIINEKSLEILFEYNGCFWHGCNKCFKNRDEINPKAKLSFKELYNKTVLRKKFIENEGYNYIEIWEHEDLLIRDRIRL